MAGEDISDLNKAVYDGEKTTINLSPEAGEQLFQHWVDQAVSGLMAAVATKRYSLLIFCTGGGYCTHLILYLGWKQWEIGPKKSIRAVPRRQKQ